MPPISAFDMRSNLGTWAVPASLVPGVTACMRETLSSESYDPHFLGQELETTYLDTRKLQLRKTRLEHSAYLTLRVRCYRTPANTTYALSAKTADEKFRIDIESVDASALTLPNRDPLLLLSRLLPGHLFARLLEVCNEQPLLPVVAIRCTRYAVEDAIDRLTLDVSVRTDTDKCLPFAVLEFKSGEPGATPPAELAPLGLRPTKLSKFLWATEV